MARQLVFLGLTVLIALAGAHTFLWMKGIRPSRRSTLWEHYTWGLFPKDEQQSHYVKVASLTILVALPIAALIVDALFDVYDKIMK